MSATIEKKIEGIGYISIRGMNFLNEKFTRVLFFLYTHIHARTHTDRHFQHKSSTGLLGGGFMLIVTNPCLGVLLLLGSCVVAVCCGEVCRQY